MEPNKENIGKWVAALRSGKYEQGYHRLAEKPHLFAETQYCCLGVACEVAIKDGLDLQKDGPGFFGAGPTLYGDNLSVLPREVQQWLGLSGEDPVIGSRAYRGQRPVTAISANDSLEYSFRKIADLLEETYLTDTNDTTHETDPTTHANT